MLALFGPLRAVARRQLPAVARRASSTSAPTVPVQDAEPESLQDLSEQLIYYAEEQEALRAGSEGQVGFDDDGIVDTVPVVTAGGKTYPMLKGFQIGQLTQPKQFTRTEYNKARSFTKRPLLGPDAATSKELDIFYQKDLDPLKECQNSSLMSRFVTSMGKIKGRNETKLTWKNQRRIGKAIRRAKMMGIIPVLSRRDLLRDDMNHMTG